jgi:hypothetical protein
MVADADCDGLRDDDGWPSNGEENIVEVVVPVEGCGCTVPRAAGERAPLAAVFLTLVCVYGRRRRCE